MKSKLKPNLESVFIQTGLGPIPGPLKGHMGLMLGLTLLNLNEKLDNKFLDFTTVLLLLFFFFLFLFFFCFSSIDQFGLSSTLQHLQKISIKNSLLRKY